MIKRLGNHSGSCFLAPTRLSWSSSPLPDEGKARQEIITMSKYSVSPAGERFPLPEPEDDAREFQRVQALAADARAEGKEIVVVMGVGFVGAVMAAIVAD